jgi:hypothetical protein
LHSDSKNRQTESTARTSASPESSKTAFYAYEEKTRYSERQCKRWLDKIDLSPLPTSPHPYHPKSLLGLEDLFGKQTDCYTYNGRFGRYTDVALNIRYRKPSIDEEKLFYDVDFHEVSGPVRPPKTSIPDWTEYLKQRNTRFNTEIPPQSIESVISWRALSDGCGAGQRQHQAGRRTAIVLRFYEGYVLVSAVLYLLSFTNERTDQAD